MSFPLEQANLSIPESQMLSECEIVIQRGLATFVEVGNALARIRDERLYRVGFGTFDDYCLQRWQMKRAHAYRLIGASEVIADLSPIGDILPSNEAQIRPLTIVPREDRQEVWQEIVDTAPHGKITAQHVQQVVRQFAPSPEFTYDGNEWYTPAPVVEAARKVLGAIDVDPASCEYAQGTVQAAIYHTKKDDGLQHEWAGKVWLNPPYSYPEVEHFSRRLVSQFDNGITTEAILLVNNCTDADWFQDLLQRFPVCFTDGRIRFERPDMVKFQTRQGQAFFYLGSNLSLFKEVFTSFGTVVQQV